MLRGPVILSLVRLWITLAIAITLPAANPPARPKILGVARMSLYVKDLAKARQFYEDFMGYAEAPASSPNRVLIYINDRQSIELINEPDAGEGQLHHIAIYTDNAARLRDYLASQNVSAPAKVVRDERGDLTFEIQDPDGHAVEFIQYRSNKAGALPSSRISDRMYHVGILVGDLDKSMKFYNGILGFQEFWRGSSSGRVLSWVNMRVPDGEDYIEFMLYEKLPPAGNRGSSHHICLLVPDMQRAVADLESRPARKQYSRDIQIRTGVNRKRQVNLFDPDGTRTELMEQNTVDGAPAPSSTAPPPHPPR